MQNTARVEIVFNYRNSAAAKAIETEKEIARLKREAAKLANAESEQKENPGKDT